MKHRISIIIPTRNRKHKLIRLIDSLLEACATAYKCGLKDLEVEFIIVDDASTDNTYEAVRMFFSRISIKGSGCKLHWKLLRNTLQLYTTEARNRGIRHATGDYILFIDDDNVVSKDFLCNIINAFNVHPRIGVVAPLMLYYSDPGRIWCAGVKRDMWTTLTFFIFRGKRVSEVTLRPLLSDDFPNAFIVRREVLRSIGLFDSINFPIHYEEADFCARARKAGYLVIMWPWARVYHDIPPLESGSGIVIAFHMRSPVRAYFAVRNRFLFHAKWSKNNLQFLVSLLFSTVVSIMYLLVALFYSPRNQRKAFLVAIVKGLTEGIRRALKIRCCS